jgi:hypothetical protein
VVAGTVENRTDRSYPHRRYMLEPAARDCDSRWLRAHGARTPFQNQSCPPPALAGGRWERARPADSTYLGGTLASELCQPHRPVSHPRLGTRPATTSRAPLGWKRRPPSANSRFMLRGRRTRATRAVKGQRCEGRGTASGLHEARKRQSHRPPHFCDAACPASTLRHDTPFD